MHYQSWPRTAVAGAGVLAGAVQASVPTGDGRVAFRRNAGARTSDARHIELSSPFPSLDNDTEVPEPADRDHGYGKPTSSVPKGTHAYVRRQVPQGHGSDDHSDDSELYPDRIRGNCGMPDMTQELWDGGEGDRVIQWMAYQMDYYQHNPEGRPSFLNYILEVHFPDVAPVHTDCNLINGCSHISCKHFMEKPLNWSQEQYEHERRMAVYAANSLSNFHNFFKFFNQAFHDAAARVDAIHADIIMVFSWADEERKKKLEEQRKLKEKLAIAMLVVLVVTAIIGAAAPLISGTVATGVGVAGGAAVGVLKGVSNSLISKVGAIVGKSVQTAPSIGRQAIDTAVNVGGKVQENANIGKQAGFLTSTFMGVSSGAYAGGSGLGQFYMDPNNDFFHEQDLEWSRLWTSVADLSEDFLMNMTLGLMAGLDLGQGAPGRENQTIVEVIRDAGFYLQPDPTLARDVTEYLEKELTAQAIDLMWREGNHPYIVATDAPGGLCMYDDRSHEAARVCLDEEPGKSFWLYTLDKGAKKGNSHVHRPPGLKTLEELPDRYKRISREDIVRSSMRWYNITKNKEMPNNVTELLGTFNPMDILDLVVKKQPTSFHLPVCYNPRGEAISSLNNYGGKNYPCLCGDFSWDKPHSVIEDESAAFLQNSGLRNHPDFLGFCDKEADCARGKEAIWGVVGEKPREDGGFPRQKYYKEGPHTVCKKANGHVPKEDKGKGHPGEPNTKDWT